MKKESNVRLSFILGLSFLNLLAWNMFVPIFELPSEQLYFHRVYEIYTTKKLPNLREAQIGDLIYPDTYPLLLTPVMALFKPPNIFLPGTRTFDPQVIQDAPAERGRFNRFFHPVWEKTFRWNNFAWSVHSMRFLTSLLYLVSVWITYQTSKKLFNATNYMPLAILLFTAFLPKMIHRAASLVNLPLLFLSFSLFYYFALTRRPDRATSLLLGLAAGLGVITKITGYNLVLFFIIYLLFFIPSWRGRLAQLPPFLFGYLILSGWYYIRNTVLYHNPVATIFLQPPTPEEVIPNLGGPLNYWYAVVTTTWQTFWDGFGWEHIILGRWIHWLINVLTVMAVFGIVVYLKQAPRRLERPLKFSLATLVVYGVVFLIINLKFFTPQGKDFMPVLFPLALIFVVGLKWWWHRSPLRHFHLPVSVFAVILFALNALLLLLSVTPKTLGEANISKQEYYQQVQPGPIHRLLLSIIKS